jgi:hypothetical protein
MVNIPNNGRSVNPFRRISKVGWYTLTGERSSDIGFAAILQDSSGGLAGTTTTGGRVSEYDSHDQFCIA